MNVTTRLLHIRINQVLSNAHKMLINMVRLTGFEPVAYGLEDPSFTFFDANSRCRSESCQRFIKIKYLIAAVKCLCMALIHTTYYTFATRYLMYETPAPFLYLKAREAVKYSVAIHKIIKVIIAIEKGTLAFSLITGLRGRGKSLGNHGRTYRTGDGCIGMSR